MFSSSVAWTKFQELSSGSCIVPQIIEHKTSLQKVLADGTALKSLSKLVQLTYGKTRTQIQVTQLLNVSS